MSTEQAPPATVRFDCPACGAVLTVPGAAAGLQGPCPKCWQEIVSPDPGRGLPARLPAPPAPIPAPVPTERPVAEEPSAPSAPPAAAATRPVSKTAFVGTCLLSAAVFASGGYLIGKSHQPVEKTPVPSIPASPKPGPASPSPAPVENTPSTVTPDVPPVVPQEALTPELALRAFLDASDWQARSARVLSPDEVRPKMEKYAAEHGDGPIPVTAIELIQAVGPNHIFKVSTAALPEGFWVGVTQTDEGPMIDWETFIGFHDDHFKKLLDGPVDGRGQFDVLVKPEPDSPDQPRFGRYRLSVPMPGRETIVWIRKDSMGLARLRALFEGSSGIDKKTVDQAVAEEGIPMVLALVKRQTPDGRGYIEIEDFIAVSWDPVDP